MQSIVNTNNNIFCVGWCLILSVVSSFDTFCVRVFLVLTFKPQSMRRFASTVYGTDAYKRTLIQKNSPIARRLYNHSI